MTHGIVDAAITVNDSANLEEQQLPSVCYTETVLNEVRHSTYTYFVSDNCSNVHFDARWADANTSQQLRS